MEIEVGFKTKGKANLTLCADNVGNLLFPANNLAHTLFKQINFKVNGALLTEQVNMYHLKAYYQTLLNYDRYNGETILQTARWRNEIDSLATYTDTNVKNNEANYRALSAGHKESMWKQKADARDNYVGGQRRMLRMKPFIDAFY